MDFCLPPLLAEAGDEHTVILVDDASTDGSASYVRTRYPQVRVVRLPRNRGFAGAVRAGIAACETPLFALINTDVQTRPGFLQAMLPHFGEAATFAVCSRIELPGGSQMETGNVAPAFDRGLLAQHVAYVWARLVSEVLRGDGMMCRAVLRALPLAPWVMMKRWREHRRGDVSDRAILQMARPPSADEFVETTVG